MSLSLGEKLRQAREERGFTLADVAEQTRISHLYLESIENDDYRILPGGIFNKGFVKSYAKFVGVDEAEALDDYAALMGASTPADSDDQLKVYRPEVLTDDRTVASMLPTVIMAAVILGLMTAGILFLVNYIRQPQTEQANVSATPSTDANSATGETPSETPVTTGEAPSMASLKVDFKALSEPVSLTATSDGKLSSNIVVPGTVASFEPRESLKLSYSRSLANVVELTINGKTIALPAQPLVPRRNAIEFEINKDNLTDIWTRGSIAAEVPAAAPVPPATVPTVDPAAGTEASPSPVASPASTPVRTPSPRPTVERTPAANSSPAPASTPARRPAETPVPQPRATSNSQA